MLHLTLMWPRGQYPHQGWALKTKEKVPYGGRIWKRRLRKRSNKEERKRKSHIWWAFGVIGWIVILSTTLQVTRKSQEDSSLSLESKSFGNNLVDLSRVRSYLRFVMLSPRLLPHVAYQLSALFHVRVMWPLSVVAVCLMYVSWSRVLMVRYYWTITLGSVYLDS